MKPAGPRQQPGKTPHPRQARAPRFLVCHLPGWPLSAWALAEEQHLGDPVAVVAANRVVCCTPAATAEGVHPGQRRRQAQGNCPGLRLVRADEARDAREFEAVLTIIERLSPGVQLVQPGTCAVLVNGLASYLGGEDLAAEVIIEAVITELGVDSVRIGIADGLFTAVQASHQGRPVRLVPPGGSAEFLAPLPVSVLGDAELATLLPRLGINTLAGFVQLGEAAIRERFGTEGVRLHRLATGVDPTPARPRTPPPELIRYLEFEPALALVDQVGFSSRRMVSDFVENLMGAGLACTELRIEFTGERDELLTRVWAAPTPFDATAIIDRIRWQLQATTGLRSAVTSVRLIPLRLEPLGDHAPSLFAGNERLHHALSRIQGLLGHAGVLTPRLAGGRWLGQRQLLIPWGDRPPRSDERDRPWPGAAPDPQPATVFPKPQPVELRCQGGVLVSVDTRGRLNGEPVELRVGSLNHPIQAWAGPWPIAERGWDANRHRQANRFQVVDNTGVAWLLFGTERGWWAEARYD